MNSYSDFIFNQLTGVSKVALTHFGSISEETVKAGDNNQVLTAADIAIGKQLVAAVTQHFPEHSIIDEEAGVIDKNSLFTWVIDPIDGTSNFAGGLPHYGIMIGLLENGNPIAGGIALPSFDQILVATKGQGSWLNQKQQVKVSTQVSSLNSLVAYGIDGHQENPDMTFNETKTLAKIILQIRNLRSTNSAYDMAMVAQGKYACLLNQTSKIWDNVAPNILITEAGGLCTDFWGKPQDFSNPISKANQNFTICAGSSTIHKQLQSVINS